MEYVKLVFVLASVERLLRKMCPPFQDLGCLGSSPLGLLRPSACLKGLFSHQVELQLPKNSSSYPCMGSPFPLLSVCFEGEYLQTWTAVRGALCAMDRVTLKPHHVSPAVCPITCINEDTNLPSPMESVGSDLVSQNAAAQQLSDKMPSQQKNTFWELDWFKQKFCCLFFFF